MLLFSNTLRTDLIAMNSFVDRSGNPSKVDVRFTPQFLNNVIQLFGKCSLSWSLLMTRSPDQGTLAANPRIAQLLEAPGTADN